MIAAGQRRELNTMLLIAGVAAVVAVAYADTFVSMAALWSNTSYSHGLLVFPISAVLLWRLRSPLAAQDLRPWPWGLAILAGLVILWLVSSVVSLQAGEQLAAVLLIPAAVATCLGLPLARRALFPLLFLLVAVPAGDALIPPLMRITADVSAWLLRVVGVPVFREGQFLSLPGGDFEVADVCSGLRSLIAGTTIAMLFAYLTFKSNLKRTLFVAATTVCLIVVNGVRAFIVMWVASATELKLLAGSDHIYFGWVLFGIVMGALFWYGLRFRDADDPGGQQAGHGDSRGAPAWPVVLVLGVVMLAITARPFREDLSVVWWLLPGGALLLWLISRILPRGATAGAAPTAANRAGQTRGGLVIAAAAAVLIGGPILVNRGSEDAGSAGGTLVLPAVASCDDAGPWSGGWQPAWTAPDFGISGSYACGDQPVHVFVAGYRRSTQGRELISEANEPIADEWRRFSTQHDTRFPTAANASTSVTEVRVTSGAHDLLIWYWYSVGERSATTPIGVKVVQVLEWLTSGRTDGALFWLETPAAPTLDAARSRLASAAREIAALKPTATALAAAGRR